MPRTALITGITGQDGAYLAELLLQQGYTVHGIKRRASSFNTDRVDHLYSDPHQEGVRFFMHYGDMTDATNLIRVVQETQPDEIYNLAAQSHVQVSFETPEYTANSDALGTLRLLEAAAHPRHGAQGALLPGLDERDVRARPGDPAARDHAVLPAQPVRRRQGLRLLDHGQLPRGVRHPRLERHPLQPREPDPRRDLRDAQDHARRGAHRPRPAGRLLPRQPRLAPRLGSRARLRARHVPDAAAGRAGRLRDRHRQAAQRARVRAARLRRGRHHAALRGRGGGGGRRRRRGRPAAPQRRAPRRPGGGTRRRRRGARPARRARIRR